MSIIIIIIEYMPMEAQEKVHYGIMISDTWNIII